MNLSFHVLIPVYSSDTIKDYEDACGALVPTSGAGVRFETDNKKIGYGRTDGKNYILNLNAISYAIITAAEAQNFMTANDISVLKAWITCIAGYYYFALGDVFGELTETGNSLRIFQGSRPSKDWYIHIDDDEYNNSNDVCSQELIMPKQMQSSSFLSSDITCERKNFMDFNTQNLFKNIKFGKADRRFTLSLQNQVAFNGKYYDGSALQDTMGLTLDIDGLLYIMPTQELKKGDIVVKDNDALHYDGEHYISLTTGQIADYVPTKIFNMTFYSVVKNLAGNMFSGDGQMNNMLPFLLLGRDNDSDSLVKFMLLSQGGFNLFGATPAQPAKK